MKTTLTRTEIWFIYYNGYDMQLNLFHHKRNNIKTFKGCFRWESRYKIYYLCIFLVHFFINLFVPHTSISNEIGLSKKKKLQLLSINWWFKKKKIVFSLQLYEKKYNLDEYEHA